MITARKSETEKRSATATVFKAYVYPELDMDTGGEMIAESSEMERFRSIATVFRLFEELTRDGHDVSGPMMEVESLVDIIDRMEEKRCAALELLKSPTGIFRAGMYTKEQMQKKVDSGEHFGENHSAILQILKDETSIIRAGV